MSDPPIEFTLHLSDGRPTLALTARTAFGWLAVESLQLELPDLGTSITSDGDVRRLQRRRCRVLTATLAADDEGLDRLAHLHAGRLLAAGIDEVRLRALDGVVEIAARVHDGPRSAELTARATLAAAGERGVTVAIDDVRLYGWLGRPAQLVAHDLLVALLGAVGIDPLDEVLLALLPPAGWRLPDARAAAVIDARVTRGRMQIGYGARAETAALPARPRLAAADARLFAGAPLDEVAAGYRAALAAGETHALERLLAVLAAQPATLAEADRLARQTLARDPDSVPGLLTRAAVAVAAARNAEAATIYERLVALAESAGDDEDAVRAALAAARTGGAADPIRLYESVFERRPRHAEAAEALAERYAAAGRWNDLVRLAHRRIAASTDRHEQAREHARAGEVYLAHLADPQRAQAELTRATALHDRDPRSWDLLARARQAAGDRAGTIRAIERQISLFAAKGDVLGEGRAHLRAGILWENEDLERAHHRYRRAIELLPGDGDALERLAAVATQRGARDEAIAAWERLAELAMTDEPRRKKALQELAMLLIAAGDLGRARTVLRGVAGGTPDAEAAAALGEAAWRARSWEHVIETYQPLITALRDSTTLEAAGRVAHALETLGRPDEAMAIHAAIAETPEAAGQPLKVARRRLAELHERRAAGLRQAGDRERAVAELEAALRLVPDHLPSLDALESIHAEANQPERVAVILGRKIAATSRQPDKQRALLARLADLQETALGRPDVAREIRKRIEDLQRAR